MNFRKITFFTLFTLVMSGQVLAQVQRVAVVNAARVLKESNAAIETRRHMEHEFLLRDKSLVSQREALRILNEKFESEVLTLTETQRTQRRTKLVEQSREYENVRNALELDKISAIRANNKKMISLAKKVVKRVADADKYDVVLQDAVYVNPQYDITDKVISGMNAEPSP